MFHSARIRLTLWYVVIIVGLTSMVSTFIYLGLNQELTHIERFQQAIKQQSESALVPFQETVPKGDKVIIQVPGGQVARQIVPRTLLIDVSALRARIILTMVMINAGIAVAIGLLSYLLAGKTLEPIQAMVEEQKRFLADASHELRTPLTSLRTATEVSLRDKGLSLTEAKKLLKENLDEVKNLQYLSEGLLRLSALENQEVTLALQTVPLAEVVQEAVKKVSPQARAKRISITHDVLSHKLKGDRFALVEVLVILLDNAIKYSPRHTHISVTAIKRKQTIRISIADQGIGIESTDIPHIFDRFYRADQSRSATFGTGYGLGLSIARRLVEHHHGRIEVASQVGQGTTFTIVLPV